MYMCFVDMVEICTVAALGPGVNYFYFVFVKKYLAFVK